MVRRAPAEFPNTSKGQRGEVVRKAFQDVGDVVQGLSVERGQERVGDFLNKTIPVTVHEVVDDSSRGFVQVGITVGRFDAAFHVGNKQYTVSFGRKRELGNRAVRTFYFFCFGAGGIHFTKLSAGKEKNGVVVKPAGIALAFRGTGDLPVVLSVQIHNKQFAVALVLFYEV